MHAGAVGITQGDQDRGGCGIPAQGPDSVEFMSHDNAELTPKN